MTGSTIKMPSMDTTAGIYIIDPTNIGLNGHYVITAFNSYYKKYYSVEGCATGVYTIYSGGEPPTSITTKCQISTTKVPYFKGTPSTSASVSQINDNSSLEFMGWLDVENSSGITITNPTTDVPSVPYADEQHVILILPNDHPRLYQIGNCQFFLYVHEVDDTGKCCGNFKGIAVNLLEYKYLDGVGYYVYVDHGPINYNPHTTDVMAPLKMWTPGNLLFIYTDSLKLILTSTDTKITEVGGTIKIYSGGVTTVTIPGSGAPPCVANPPSSELPTPVCSGGTKCVGYSLYRCVDGAWKLVEANSTQCGYKECNEDTKIDISLTSNGNSLQAITGTVEGKQYSGYLVSPGSPVDIKLSGTLKEKSTIKITEVLPTFGGWPKDILDNTYGPCEFSAEATFTPRDYIDLGQKYPSSLSKIIIYLNGTIYKTIYLLIGKLENGKFVGFAEYAPISTSLAVYYALKKEYGDTVTLNKDVTTCVQSKLPCISKATVLKAFIDSNYIHSNTIMKASSFDGDYCKYILSGYYPVKTTVNGTDYIAILPATFLAEANIDYSIQKTPTSTVVYLKPCNNSSSTTDPLPYKLLLYEDGKLTVSEVVRPGTIKITKPYDKLCITVDKTVTTPKTADYSPAFYMTGISLNYSFQGTNCNGKMLPPSTSTNSPIKTTAIVIAGVAILHWVSTRHMH